MKRILSLLAAVSLMAAYDLFAATPLGMAPLALGVATTVPRFTDERPGDIDYLPLAANTKIPAGALVATDANGRAVNAADAADTAGRRVVGRAEETVDNTGGGAGALSINVKRGVFKFLNSADDPVTAAHFDKLVFVEDNQTVAIDSDNFIGAGRCRGIDPDDGGVWVDTRDIRLAAVPAATSTDGTFAAAADLAAAKAEGEKVGDDVRAVIAALKS